jgi:hypothetical protein
VAYEQPPPHQSSVVDVKYWTETLYHVGMCSVHSLWRLRRRGGIGYRLQAFGLCPRASSAANQQPEEGDQFGANEIVRLSRTIASELVR